MAICPFFDGIFTSLAFYFNMKKVVPVLAVVFFSFLFTRSSLAQSVGVPPQGGTQMQTQTQNAIYLEILGNGILYTINYDRLLGQDYGFRVGLGYLGLSRSSSNNNDDGGTTASASLLVVPATFNYFLASHSGGTVGSSKLELGVGIVFLDVSASVSSGGVGTLISGSGGFIGETATIGYRYQPYDGGFLFRIAFTPIFTKLGFLPWGGVSFGLTF
jgi:hypothetical protein